ncbi:MAG: translocation/assembly module TamB domain-containing protein [Polyangiaceae bacterium]
MTRPGRPPEALAAAPRIPGRFRRALAMAAATGGLGVVFVGALAGGLLLHLDAGPTRRIAREVVNTQLATVFHGRILADEIERISLSGVRIQGATVLDPHGHTVVRATSIRARADVPKLAYDALFGTGPLLVELPWIRIENADVSMEMGDEGVPTIADAFALRETPPKEPSAPSTPSRDVRVHMTHIEIGHAWAHGMIADPRSLDAEVTKLVGQVRVEPDGVLVDTEPVSIVDRALLPSRTQGTGEYHLRVGFRPGGEDSIRMWMSFTGQIDEVAVTARGTIEEGFLSAQADIPDATREQIIAVIPGLPLREPITASIVLEGEIPTFDVTAQVRTHPRATHQASASATGGFDATGPLSMRLAVTAEAFDPRVLDESYPDVRVDAAGTVEVLLAEGTPRVIVDARTSAAELDSVKVPAADVHAVLDRGVLSGNTHLYEPGLPIDATVLGDDGGLRFKPRSRIPSMAAAPRLAGALDGSADVRVSGTLVDGRLEASVDGSVSNVKTGGDVSLEHGTVRGTVRGRLDEPGALEVAATLKGTRARTGGYEFAEVTATARGPARAPRLSATLTDGQTGFVSAEGVLDPSAAAVRDVTVEVERDGNKVSGRIARIGAAQGGVVVEGVSLSGEGMGSLQGGLLVRGDDISGKLKGQGVDVARVARLMGIPYKVQGLANVDIDVTRTRSGRKGHVKLELVDGETPLVSGISAQLTATLDDDKVTLDALARLVAEAPPGEAPAAPQLPNDLPRCVGTIAQVRITKGEGTLSGPLLAARTWLSTRGRVEVAAEDWNLGCLARLFPVGLPVSEVRGTATTRFVVERGEADRFPSVPSFTFRTHQLAVLGPQGLHDTEPEWASTSMDLKLEGSLDGKSGETTAKLSLYDGYLPPEVAATVTLDLPTLVDQPAKRRASLLASPLTARLTMPRRAIEELRTLPTPVHPYLPPLAGDVRLDGYVDGTIAEPFLTVRAIGWNLAYTERGARAVAASAWSLPVDVDLLATYDTHQGTLDAHVTKGGREIVSANAQIDADLAALMETKAGQKAPWTGGFYAKLDEVPLGELPRLADNGIAGHVAGTISMTGMNQAPALKVALTLPDLKIGDDLYFEEGAVTLDISRGQDGKERGIATARFIGHDGGRLDATGYAGIVWKDGLLPAIDDAAPADLHARTASFRLAALHPLVSDVLSKLDGQVDGDIRIGWKRIGDEEQGSIVARMDVRNGVFHVPQIGQEFRNTTVKIRTADQAAQAKDGLIRFDDIQAEGISGHVRGWAIARVDGLRFLDAGGALTVAEGAGNELPITLEGVPLGTAWGNVTLKAEKTDNTIAVAIGVPQLHITLPSAPSKNVQTLDENPDISVSHPLGPEKELRAADALRWQITFDLGRIVVQGTGIGVRLRGVATQPPRVELTDKARVTGDIEIVEGIVAAYGKEFRIERGLVRMRAEDTSNPYLNVTAYWDSPDGARIYVDYVGILKPVTDDKLRFRSNPPRSEQDILATLLFGADFEQDPGGRSRGADATRATGNLAAGVGGGVAAEQLNEMLAGTALHNFSTRIGTNEEGNVKTSLVFAVSESVTSTYSYENTGGATGAQGGPGGGASGQRSGRYQVSIDWRFQRNWWCVATSATRPVSPPAASTCSGSTATDRSVLQDPGR